MHAHAISCSSYQFSRTVKMVGSARKYGCLDIVDTFSRTFRNPIFRFPPVVEYENLDYKNPKFSNIFSIFTNSQIQKLEVQKFEILIQTSVLSKFAFSQIQSLDNKKSEIFKHPSFRYSPIDFQTSLFSIFVYSQTHKLGFQKSEIFKRPSFKSIFAYIQIRKLRSQKSEISKRPAEHPAFLIFVIIKIQKLRSFRK